MKRHEGCRISGSFGAGEIPLPPSFFYLLGRATELHSSRSRIAERRSQRHCQVGSLAGAAHLLNDNADVLRGAHGGRKPPVEQKGKSPLDFDFQCEYKP